MDSKKQTEPKWVLWIEWTIFIAIMVLATYLRYWRIGEVPPGFNSDEAVGAVGALKTLREGISYSYEGQGGGGVLGFYFAAAAFYLFGPSIATIRGLAAWAGLVGIFAHYWAVREMFRGSVEQETQVSLNRARLISALSTLGLAVSVWHLQASRVAFAGIGVPFLLMPSIYLLWRGLNRSSRQQGAGVRSKFIFIGSGLFLGSLMYIYLSGAFAPPLYAAFFITQWLIVLISRRFTKEQPSSEESTDQSIFGWRLVPTQAYLTTQFWNIFAAALTATLLLVPLVFVLLTSPSDEPGLTRVSQASFLNPNINLGDPWGLLWRSFVGNFSAFGISFSWFVGQLPDRLTLPPIIGLMVFLGFLISLWRGLRGEAAYLFTLLWFCIMLFPSILSPDSIPHTLRAIGATDPTYILAAIFIVDLFWGLWYLGKRLLLAPLGAQNYTRLASIVGIVGVIGLVLPLWQATSYNLFQYFYIFPNTNDVEAAYHFYAVEMAEEINRDTRSNSAFILPRNTAAGDVNPNFTTDFLVDLDQPPATHHWVIDDETTLADDLTNAAATNDLIRVITWQTSKHTGADPKEVIPYYLEKFGHYEVTESFKYFDISTYKLETSEPDFAGGEVLTPLSTNFGHQVALTQYGFGSASDANAVTQPQAHSNDLLWLRLGWEKLGDHPENLKVSALLYNKTGQLITQIDKLLISNILQFPSQKWDIGDQEDTYFLIPIPPATAPGEYDLRIAVYQDEALTRLPIISTEADATFGQTISLGTVTVLPAKQAIPVDKAALAYPIQQEFVPGLTLIGMEALPSETVYSGNEILGSLLWSASSPIQADVKMSFMASAIETNEQILLSGPTDLVGIDYPTSQWQTGDVLRGWLNVRIPPTVTPGMYNLNLQLETEEDPALVTLLLGEFQVDGWTRNFEAPTPQLPLDASFNDQVRLVGLDTTTLNIAPGETVAARLYWQVESEFEQNYTAFIHLIGPDGLLYGQMDHVPGNGAFPTTGWLTGEYIADEYLFPVANNAPAGEYNLAIGLYNTETGERLRLTEGSCLVATCNEGDDAVRIPGLTTR